MAEDKGLQPWICSQFLSQLSLSISPHPQSGLISSMKVMLFPSVGMVLSLLGAWVTESQNHRINRLQNQRIPD